MRKVQLLTQSSSPLQNPLPLGCDEIPIYDVQYSPSERYPLEKNVPQRFQGACLDIGAEKSVIVIPQAEAYAYFSNSPILPQPTSDVFRFGDGCFPSIGTVRIVIPTGTSEVLRLTVSIVDADVPFLLGLDTLDAARAFVDNVDNVLRFKDKSITIPLVRKLGHVYLEWSFPSTLFS